MYIDNDEFGEWMQKLYAKLEELCKDVRVLRNADRVLPEDDNLLDNQDLCLLFKVSIKTLQRYRAIGALPYFTISGKVYYKASDVREFIKERFSITTLRQFEKERKYSINSLVYWVTYVHNVVYSFYRSMIYCYINSTQRCAGSIVIDIIPTNGADKRKFFPFAPYFPVTNVIKRYFYPYFPAIIGIKGYSFPYFPYLSGIMKIKTALYSLFSRLDWHKTVVFPCLGEIYEGIRSLSWEIPVT